MTEHDDGATALPRHTTPTWEVELLISGVAVFAMLQLPELLDNYILDWAPRLVDRWAKLLFVVYVYAKSAALILAVTFVIHLLLRARWIALVGMLSIYPEGRGLGPLPPRPQRARVREQAPGPHGGRDRPRRQPRDDGVRDGRGAGLDPVRGDAGRGHADRRGVDARGALRPARQHDVGDVGRGAGDGAVRPSRWRSTSASARAWHRAVSARARCVRCSASIRSSAWAWRTTPRSRCCRAIAAAQDHRADRDDLHDRDHRRVDELLHRAQSRCLRQLRRLPRRRRTALALGGPGALRRPPRSDPQPGRALHPVGGGDRPVRAVDRAVGARPRRPRAAMRVAAPCRRKRN